MNGRTRFMQTKTDDILRVPFSHIIRFFVCLHGRYNNLNEDLMGGKEPCSTWQNHCYKEQTIQLGKFSKWKIPLLELAPIVNFFSTNKNMES